MALKPSHMHIFWWNFTKLLIFMTLIWKVSRFLKIEIFGPPTKNSDFSNFSGILLQFSTEIENQYIHSKYQTSCIWTNSVACIVSEIYSFQFLP